MKWFLGIVIVSTFFIPSFSHAAGCSWTSFSKTWLNCQTITITNRASSTPSSVAIPLILSSSSINMAHLKADASDIRIVSSTDDTTVYNSYAESFVGNQGTSTLWINLGQVPTGVSTYSMYYNNPSAPNLFSSTSTFSTSTYVLAANLTDSSNTSILDDTGYGNNAKFASTTPQNATSTSCVLSGCELSSSSNPGTSPQFINFATSTSLGLVANTSSTGNNVGSIGVWFYELSSSSIWGKSDNNGSIGWTLDSDVTSNGALKGQEVFSATNKNRIVNSKPSNTWHHYLVTIDSTSLNTSTLKIYIDGTESAYNSGQQGSGTQGDHTTRNLYLGFTDVTGLQKGSGFFDEFELFPSVLSSSTVYFLWQTQSNQALSFGSENSAPCIPKAGYSYCRPVTFNHNFVASSTNSENYTNFPALVSSTLASFKTTSTDSTNGRIQNVNGWDITFTSDIAGKNNLSCEAELYTSSTGRLVFWVANASGASSTVQTSTDVTDYISYGNSAISSPQCASTSVWDSNYKGVYHLAASSSISGSDSTANGNNGTINSVTASSSGKVDGAGSFNGAGAGNNVTITGLFGSPASGTLESWENETANGVSGAWMISLGDSFSLAMDNFPGSCSPATTTPVVDGYYYTGATWRNTCIRDDAGQPYNKNTGFHYFAYTIDGTAQKQNLYADGNLGATSSWADTISYSGVGTNTLIGHHANGSNSFNFTGALDETRVSNIVRSADWIKTTYNAINNSNSFETIGSEVAAPAAITSAPFLARTLFSNAFTLFKNSSTLFK